ncbi:MAG: hypothetical protein LBR53_05050 [Deltaproteobacteria bacterium]|nr:hypothetical protein [Deltaproteobacteria bacterium]
MKRKRLSEIFAGKEIRPETSETTVGIEQKDFSKTEACYDDTITFDAHGVTESSCKQEYSKDHAEKYNNGSVDIPDPSRKYHLDSPATQVHIRKLTSRIVIQISFGLAIFCLLLMTVFREKVYTTVDAIVSWNSWAMSWASGVYPGIYGDYPQLMPILMSIPAAMAGIEIPQIFAILCYNAALAISLLSFWTLRGTNHAVGAAVAALGTVWLRRYTSPGHADILVGTAALSAFTALQWYIHMRMGRKTIIRVSDHSFPTVSPEYEGGSGSFYLWTAFMAASACAVIKQSGLFWFPFFVLIAYESLRCEGVDGSVVWRILWKPCLAAFAIAVPWYVYNKYLMNIGEVVSMTNFFLSDVQLYKEMGFFGRAIYALFRYAYYTLFAVAAILCLKKRGYRCLSISCLFFMAGWLLFFSYSAGNAKFPVMLAFFPLGIILAEIRWDCGIARMSRTISSKIIKVGNLVCGRPAELLAIIICIVAVISFSAPAKIDHALLEFQNRQTLSLGEIGLTRRIDYLERQESRPMLSADGRLMQIRSCIEAGYSVFTLDALENPLLNWGYIVIHRKDYTGRAKEILDAGYRLDYAEKTYMIFVKKE